ncbi:MAG TPA: LemA family protein [Methylibium sp.]|nr:LemA family protein [Methylibium sp.]
MSTTTLVMLVGAALLGFWAVGAYNRLVRLRGAAIAAWGPLDAQLRRRQALAIELTERLGAEAALDDEVGRVTLATLAAATRQAQAATDHAQVRPTRAGAIQSLALAEGVLEGALRPLRVLIELRPQLLDAPDTGTGLQGLLEALQDCEAQLGFARRLFNDAVRAFNTAVHELPTCLLAAVYGFKPAATLQVATPDRGPDSQIASVFGERA